MLKITNKLTLNLKILRFFIIPTILVLTPFFYNIQDVKAGLEFQWNQDDSYRRLKWYQKENKRKFRNKIYFFLGNNFPIFSFCKYSFLVLIFLSSSDSLFILTA